MKKVMILLAISLVATALFDVTLFFQSNTLSIAAAATVFFLAGFLFYHRITERLIINSFLTLFFLFALMSFGYTVNMKAHNMWNLVIACSVIGHVAGLVAKRIALQNGNTVKPA